MYIYDIPYETNKELCRLLDTNVAWKELADLMGYSTNDINEIEKVSGTSSSPSKQLLINWGQLNHHVGELYILLYRMRHIPALLCLKPITDTKYHVLYDKLFSARMRDMSILEDKANKKIKIHTEDDIPIPVKLIEQGIPLPTASQGYGLPIDDSEDMSLYSQGSINQELKSEIMRNVGAIPMLKYDELKEATNNWSPTNLLGQGGFAEVFKGKWKHLTVAVKRLRAGEGRDRELIRELCLNQYRHDNIVPLYGYSYGGAEVCLVYQLMCGGTLDLRLRNGRIISPLTWSLRLRIAHGVAAGLQFLHTMSGTPLIHGDIKPANILLDQCLVPKIGDFGLARKGPYGENRTHVKVSKVHGTKPYLPDEYLRSGCLSPAVDVFSFGVVLLEIATCMTAFDSERPVQRLSDHIRLENEKRVDLAIYEDPALKSIQNSNPELCRQIMNTGVQCTQYARHKRPSMLEVYEDLDTILSLQKSKV